MPSLEDRLRSTEIRSLANEKLLKALVALLALRDEHLFDELAVVFALAQSENSEVADNPPEVWSELRRELELLRNLVAAGEACEVSGGGHPSGNA